MAPLFPLCRMTHPLIPRPFSHQGEGSSTHLQAVSGPPAGDLHGKPRHLDLSPPALGEGLG